MDGHRRPPPGEVIPFIDEPGVVPLGEWRAEHPETGVLLGDRREYPQG